MLRLSLPDPAAAHSGFNQDTAGRVVAVGNDLALLTFRYPNVIEHPDGQTSDRTTYLFLSDDGGATFNPPVIVSRTRSPPATRSCSARPTR